MKIAVLLFGHLRTFEYSSKFFVENVLNKYDCDVFMHTWDETDSTTKSWNNKKNNAQIVNDEIVSKIKSIYKPKELIIEHQEVKEDSFCVSADEKKEISMNGIHYMWHSVNTANNARKNYELKNNIHYDIILVTRPDIALYNHWNIEETIKEAEFSGIDIDNARFFATFGGDSKTNVRLNINRICDVLYFAKPSVIDRYIEANSNIELEDCDRKFNNIVQIYVKNEIKAGILPVSTCFKWGVDWRNVTFKHLESLQNKIPAPKQKTKLYKFLHFYWLRNKK